MQERSLAIKERTYGRDHPDVAITLTNLGNVYGTLGDHAKKRDILERALAIFEREYGRDHTKVAITLTNLGEAHVDLGAAAEACDHGTAQLTRLRGLARELMRGAMAHL